MSCCVRFGTVIKCQAQVDTGNRLYAYSQVQARTRIMITFLCINPRLPSEMIIFSIALVETVYVLTVLKISSVT